MRFLDRVSYAIFGDFERDAALLALVRKHDQVIMDALLESMDERHRDYTSVLESIPHRIIDREWKYSQWRLVRDVREKFISAVRLGLR